MGKMTVNFNNLRKQALYSYDSLVEKLNDSLLEDLEYGRKKNEKREGGLIKGDMLLNSEDIQKEMDELRRLLGAIAMVYVPEDENFKDVFSEVYPNQEDGMALFNAEEEE